MADEERGLKKNRPVELKLKASTMNAKEHCC